ncbi:MAG: VWA domain-containing protein [Planctomycetales bacterium]|nr:VWA domain-containing protein [Planctomycetales bacterium]
MEFLTLQPLWWLAALVALAVGLRFSLVDQPFWRQAASLACRALAIVALVVGLCRPYWLSPSDQMHVVFLVDVSDSIDLAAIEESEARVQSAIDALNSGDSWTLFAVGGDVLRLDAPGELGRLAAAWRKGIQDERMRSHTRLADALLETRLAFPAGKTRRVLLMSDGRNTDGDLKTALGQLAEERVEVLLAPMQSLQEPEVCVVSLTPSTPIAFQGEMIRFRASLATNRDLTTSVRIVHKGVAEKTKQVALKAGEKNLVEFDVEVRTPGAARYTAEVNESQEDHFPLNNTAGCTVEVRGTPRVLVLHQQEQEMRPLARALSEQGIELDVRGRLGLPQSLEEMLAFEAIVLADLPATDLSQRQMAMLKSYVMDYGGGLAMLGSENSFGLGGYFKTPVEEVLPLVSRFEKEKEKPSLAMVLVIDKSSSMTGAPIALARQAAKAAVELLSPRDLIGVIGFDGSAYLISELRSAADVDAIQASIDSLQASGGTYMYPAMVQARDMLEQAPAKIRHMILLSDGHTQPADHHGLAQEATDAGITISTVALGGADRQLLSAIAQIGRGRYYETQDPATVPQIFTKETMQASKSAIKEDLYAAVRTGDHPMLSGFTDADLPFSLGYVMTEVKPTAQLLLAAETGDPLLAVGRYGLGHGLAYTSDLTERWGGEWLAWDDCGRFWAQVIRSILRKADAEGMAVNAGVEGETWRVNIRRLDESLKPVGGIAWDAAITDENGSLTAVEVKEVGLGRYLAEVPLAAKQSASLRLLDSDYNKLKVLHWQRPYPAEYALANNPSPGIADLREYSPERLREDRSPEPRRQPIANYAYLTAMALMLAGLVLRRL